jgi:predicted N-acetyltransferase YhbS
MSDDLIFEPLDASHDVAAFTCSKPPLHDYLRKHALQNAATGYSGTTVALEPTTRQVVGYFSLCPVSVTSGELPPEELKGMPKYPVPGVLLARMAVHVDRAGKGLGTRLLLLALREALAIPPSIKWRFFVVDAFDATVVPFYTKFGFKALPGNPLRLYMGVKMVTKAVQA